MYVRASFWCPSRLLSVPLLALDSARLLWAGVVNCVGFPRWNSNLQTSVFIDQ